MLPFVRFVIDQIGVQTKSDSESSPNPPAGVAMKCCLTVFLGCASYLLADSILHPQPQRSRDTINYAGTTLVDDMAFGLLNGIISADISSR